MSDDFREGENIGKGPWISGDDRECFQQYAGTRSSLLDPKDLHKYYTKVQLEEALSASNQALRDSGLAKLSEDEKIALGLKEMK
jgi:hypothetical protein